MKKIISIVLALTLMLGVCCMAVSAVTATTAASLTINTSASTAKVNDIITVTVNLSADPHIGAIDYTVSYPTVNFELVDASATAFNMEGAMVNTNVVGAITVTASTTTGSFVGGDKILTASFKVLKPGAAITVAITSATDDTFDGNDVTDSMITNSTLSKTVACDHIWNDGAVTTEPTCDVAGEKTFTCTVCGETKTEPVSSTGHNFGAWTETTAPTCTVAGEETRACQNTGCTETETRPVTPLGHNFGEWEVETPATCTAAGVEKRTCQRAGCTETEYRDTDALGHNWGAWVVTIPSTCTVAGQETRTCSACGATETRAAALAEHTYGDWIIDTPATCTEAGSKHRVCSVCNDIDAAVIDALGHDISDPEVTKNPTCTESGIKTGTCSRCHLDVEVEIAPLGHTYGNWKVTKEATKDSTGIEERVCTVCGAKETRVIAKVIDNPEIPRTGSSVAIEICSMFGAALVVSGASALVIKKRKEDK